MNLAHRLRASWWPRGPASVVVPAIAIVVVVLAATWPMLAWPYPLWVQTSAQFHQQVTWAGLIAGTVACWHATVLHPQARLRSQRRAPRLGMPTTTRHLTTLSGWFVSAYLIALLPLVMSTVLAGGAGTADPLAMLSGALAMVAAVALGYALGTVVPSPAMVLIVAVGFFALLVLGSAGGHAAVNPVLDREPVLGQRESLPRLVFQIALFVVITTTAVSLARRSLNRTATGDTPPWRKITDIAIHLVPPAALIAVSLIHPPVVFTAEDKPRPFCTERRDIRYCVHADNQPRLVDLVRRVDPVIARFGTKPTNVAQVWDQALTLHPIDADSARGLEVAWLNPDGTIETQVAETLAGLWACASTIPGNGHSSAADMERHNQVAADVSHYLSTGVPSGTLSTMSVADVQRWIAQHQEQLHTCTLTPGQLPDTQNR